MKKILTYFFLLIIPAASFSQKTDDSIPAVNTDYLAKSKNQKTAAWVLVGGGTALICAGFLIGDSKNSTFDDAATGAVLGGIGVLSAIGSIPLFIASGKNKRKSIQGFTFIRMESIPSLQKRSIIQNSYPAFSISLNL